MYKLKYFPDKDFTGTMHRLAKPGIRGVASWAKTTMTGGDHLKRVDGRLKRPAGTFIAEDQDRLAAVKGRLAELLAIRQRAAVLWIRREDVHEHVVIGLAVIAKNAQQLALDKEGFADAGN